MNFAVEYQPGLYSTAHGCASSRSVVMVAQVLSSILTNKSFQRLTVRALEVLAKRTDNTIDDQLVTLVKAKLFMEDR